MRNLKNLISNPQIFNDVKQLKAEVDEKLNTFANVFKSYFNK